MEKRLIDSVIIIDHLNNIEDATGFLLNLEPSQTVVSVITRAEVLAGLEGDHLKTVSAMLDQYETLVIDKTIADEAAYLRRKMRWKLPDAFQAALARHHQTKLVTRNTKDFDPAENDFVEVPYSI